MSLGDSRPSMQGWYNSSFRIHIHQMRASEETNESCSTLIAERASVIYYSLICFRSVKVPMMVANINVWLEMFSFRHWVKTRKVGLFSLDDCEGAHLVIAVIFVINRVLLAGRICPEFVIFIVILFVFTLLCVCPMQSINDSLLRL